jgi:hypothetical protein
MPFFIEDYFKKYEQYLAYNPHDGDFGLWKKFRNQKIDDKWSYNESQGVWVDTSKLTIKEAQEINARFESIERCQKYRDILQTDRFLLRMMNGREPCYLKDIFTQYRNGQDFFKSILAIFFGSIFEGLVSFIYMFLVLTDLLNACIHAFTKTSYDVKDDLILACYNFCISLFYVLHAVLAPVIALVSFLSRSVVTVNAWCNPHDENSEISPMATPP